jgi:hypothetical protein
MAHFTQLPLELILQIVYQLPLRDILNIKYTCKAIYQNIPASVYSLYKIESRIGSPSESQLRRAENNSIYSANIWHEGFGGLHHRTKGIGFLTSLPGIQRNYIQQIVGVTDGYGKQLIKA